MLVQQPLFMFLFRPTRLPFQGHFPQLKSRRLERLWLLDELDHQSV